jgi:hypothetical protein
MHHLWLIPLRGLGTGAGGAGIGSPTACFYDLDYGCLAVSASSGISAASSSAAGSAEGAPIVAPTAATRVASPPTAAGGVASIRGAAWAAGATARTSVAVGGAGGAVGDAASPPAVVEEASWGLDLLAEESPEEAEVEVGRVVLAGIVKIRTQRIKDK